MTSFSVHRFCRTCSVAYIISFTLPGTYSIWIKSKKEKKTIKKNKKRKDLKLQKKADFCYLRNEDDKWNKYYQILLEFVDGRIREYFVLFCFLFIAVNDETKIASTINSNESTVDCDEESRYKCSDLATDDSLSDSNTQSSHTNINCDSTEMR